METPPKEVQSPENTPKGPRVVMPSFWDYVSKEIRINIAAPKKDGFYGETRRDKLYNSMFWVGPHLERYMFVGCLACLDSFLGVLTLLPLRALLSFQLITARYSVSPEHLYNVLILCTWLLSCVALAHVKAGAIYYWMKDITPEFLKIHALWGALDILEKVLSNFGIDAVTAMRGTCSMLVCVPEGTEHKPLKRLAQLTCDTSIAWIVMTLHGVVIMCQAIIYAVALNSSQNALVALLIATQFMEVKGIVYKRYDESKLYFMAQLDLAERFTLFISLFFVLAEDMVSNGVLELDWVLLKQCCKIYACEVVLDVLKHASLAKFNDIRPGIYREYFRALTGDVEYAQSDSIMHVVSIEPYGKAALVARQMFYLLHLAASAAAARWASATASTPAAIDSNATDAAAEFAEADMQEEPERSLFGTPWLHPMADILSLWGFEASSLTQTDLLVWLTCALWAAGGWALLLVIKLVLGYAVKAIAVRYNKYHDTHYKRLFKAKR